jgi:hypothetical protein
MTPEDTWEKIARKRRGTSRSGITVRAKVVHTSHQTRALELFVSAKLQDLLGWQLGGRVDVLCSKPRLKLTAAHRGLRLCRAGKKTGTARIYVSGDFIAPSICAPVRLVPHHIEGVSLIVLLSSDWFSQEEKKEIAA